MTFNAWDFRDEEGVRPVEFTGFMSLNVNVEGDALEFPIEQGSFATYNKVSSPREFELVLAVQAVSPSTLNEAIVSLDRYKTEPRKVFITTPEQYYGPLTVVRYSYSREVESAIGNLYLSITAREIIEVATQVFTTRNPTSRPRQNTGKTQPGDENGPYKPVLKKIGDWSRRVFGIGNTEQ